MARVRMDNLIEHFSSELRSVLTRPLTITVPWCRLSDARSVRCVCPGASLHHRLDETCQ